MEIKNGNIIVANRVFIEDHVGHLSPDYTTSDTQSSAPKMEKGES